MSFCPSGVCDSRVVFTALYTKTKVLQNPVLDYFVSAVYAGELENAVSALIRLDDTMDVHSYEEFSPELIQQIIKLDMAEYFARTSDSFATQILENARLCDKPFCARYLEYLSSKTERKGSGIVQKSRNASVSILLKIVYFTLEYFLLHGLTQKLSVISNCICVLIQTGIIIAIKRNVEYASASSTGGNGRCSKCCIPK